MHSNLLSITAMSCPIATEKTLSKSRYRAVEKTALLKRVEITFTFSGGDQNGGVMRCKDGW